MATSFPSIRPSAPEPWLAVNASLVFPGLGQLYSRHWLKGSLMLTIAAALLGYAVWSIFAAEGDTLMGLGAIAVFTGLYSLGILDAYRGTQPGYATRISVPKGKRDPWYAVFLAQLLPGLGHLYINQVLVGGGLLAIGITAAILANAIPAFVIIPPLIWALGCYHVYRVFPHRTRNQPEIIALLVLGLFLVRLSLGVAPSWIQQTVEQCIVPSKSMLPTLQVGDRLFVRRNTQYQPTTGDVVVFTPPDAVIATATQDTSDWLFVKRMIGLPGQQIEIANGRVYVDGQPLIEEYLQAPPMYQWGPEVVPPNNYFVLGDNRNESSDSHVWGYVPEANFLGRAYKIYWPPARVQPLP